MAEANQEQVHLQMPVLVLRGLVLFPKMILNFDVGREKSILALEEVMKGNRKILLTAQRDIVTDDPETKDLYTVGVVAEIKQVVRNNGGDSMRVLVEGLYRARIQEIVETKPYFVADIVPYPVNTLKAAKSDMMEALLRAIKDLFEEYCGLTPRMPKELIVKVMTTEDPVYLVEYIAANIPLQVGQKQALLEESSIIKRMEMLAATLESENEILMLERDIYERVKDQIDRNQKEYYLREQQRAISIELGEDENEQNEEEEYRKKIDALKLSDEVREKLLSEAARLNKMPYNSQEAAVIRTYLDTCLELPWNKFTEDKIDLAKAQKQLDKDHYGMKKVKERIIELLAVHKLAPDIKGQIICLVGPPGVGKTSIAKSIAACMGRNYTRISLGGVRDESDIRGHRKTYIGSMPGRIINAIKLAGSANPLMLLDEVDKLGSDYKGDPSAALLEVLDAEQNFAFRDHYVEVPFDLSNVLFIATANTTETIPAPLLDRMEVIELSSYTREEKFHISREHLIHKQMTRHGLTSKTMRISDDAIYSLIDFYTRESGVRNLEREIASLCRKAAKEIVGGTRKRVTVTGKNVPDYMGPKRFRPEEIEKKNQVGVVNGLAWTCVGGEMLQAEVAVLDGTGKIVLTGSLGDVMKESAQTAISYIRSAWNKYGVEHDFYKTKDIHIHFPEGAVPKDGPSAGVTICSAIVSALTGTPARADVAMTGEITLRGRVLPIGGLREKTMAAYRAGIKTVVIPKENEPDLQELEPVVRENLRFVTAEHVDTVLREVLVQQELPSAQPGEDPQAMNGLEHIPAKPAQETVLPIRS